MNLDETKIDELIRNPKHLRELEASELHHRRLSFHSDIVLRKEHASKYINTYLYWVSRLLPKDKQERIESMMTFPLATNELCKDIFMGLERVWSAKDYIEKYMFASDEYETDFTQYLKRMKAEHLWQVEAWGAFKTAIDSVVVVDLPSVQITPRPEPYFYFIEPDDIIDLEVDECNDMQYVIFHEHEELYVYDSTSIRKYAYVNKKRGALITEVLHELDYCPARMMWSDKLQDENYINKRSPITDSLGDLDWLLFFKTSKKYLDLHAAYPIYITYDIEQESEEEDKPTFWEGQAVEKDHKGKGLMGAGSFMTVPPPLVGQPDMMSNPIQVVSAEIDALKYSVEEVVRLEQDVYESCVGSGGEMMKTEAVNEKQVGAAFKSREEVLMNVARNFAEIMTWTHETLARLRYGIFFSKALIDFGEDFYLESEDKLMDDYANAKEKGVSPLILDTINEKINDIAYRHRTKDRERADIFKYLDPLPEITIDEASALVTSGVIDKIDLKIKINLLKYIRMFEMEYGDLLDFMPNNFQQKIETINLKFQEYAMQQKPTLQPQGERGGNVPPVNDISNTYTGGEAV